MGSPTDEHRLQAQQSGAQSVNCAVLTCSDTRSFDNDTSGDLIVSLLTEAGHNIAQRDLLPDEPAQIERWIDEQVRSSEVHAILTTGGTGVAKRDATIDVIRHRLDVLLDGFGELFRVLSYNEIGSAAMLSRAVAGFMHRPGIDDDPGVLIFAMPGSAHAVELAMRRLIVPELSHLVWERRR